MILGCREKHKKRLQEHRKSQRVTIQDSAGDDEDFWRRLDELEVEEELNNYLEQDDQGDKSSSTWRLEFCESCVTPLKCCRF